MKKWIILFCLTGIIHASSSINKAIYPFSNANITKYDDVHRDKDGIPMLKYGRNYIYYPVQITQIAVHYYNHYVKTNDSKSKTYFLLLSKWLKKNFTDNGHWGGIL